MAADIIRLLPDSVANQIAAGEVIQRPASCIKELVENAVDAGATNISIIIKDAGRTLIQVIDNGSGMSETDARLAFERHATSKIRSADDLFTLRTMGFRGEALASIAAIAQLDVRTRLKGVQLGTRLLINGSEVESQEPCSTPEGTNIMVKNLFFNVPARRKFLKRDSVELGQILREFERLALVNPGVAFTFVHNDVTLHSLMAHDTLLPRIADLFSRDLHKQLVPVETDTSIVRLNGYIGLPAHARRRNPLQYLFVNGRNMRHPYFHKAVMACYEELIAPDVQPNYFLNFVVDPQSIDVNIHPTKNEIKFENEQGIGQILTAAVKEALGRYNAGPALDFEQTDAPEIPSFNPTDTLDPSLASGGGGAYNPFKSSRTTDWDKLYAEFDRRANSDAGNFMPSAINSEPAGEPREVSLQGELDLGFEAEPLPVAMQLRNRYIVTPSREGMLIIDQHRAHKRILFERHRKCSTQLAAQRLMFPEVLHLSPAQNAILEAISEELTHFAFDLSPLGDNAWSILAIPQMLDGSSAREIILSMIDRAADGGASAALGETLRDRIALTLAEAGAIKPGQPLGPSEIEKLSAELFALPSPSFTPDGMKIFAVVNLDDIAKLLN